MREKRKKAIALKYDTKMNDAPTVTAKGNGLIAANLISKAKENDVPIVKDESLANLLGELHINERIPAELYEAVASVFAFVYQLDEQARNDREK
ncbi:EscU/YscU/HrcU family type III secretion system export apparatus switch protein [Virgibacillus halophilus]|uniref:EscU/YscU/HrcU family type III secretion system export apparatus switch protein n=1 Tax=Tigheibacillus halophilus TaxID=361280 RepID=A0ABU5CAH6_9BACI|nr:EscU/YscU/HrcU family type III secretion system export apparatus switch protein [Virgibacillus halophilus]